MVWLVSVFRSFNFSFQETVLSKCFDLYRSFRLIPSCPKPSPFSTSLLVWSAVVEAYTADASISLGM